PSRSCSGWRNSACPPGSRLGRRPLAGIAPDVGAGLGGSGGNRPADQSARQPARRVAPDRGGGLGPGTAEPVADDGAVECPAGYSSAGCSPAEPASASPAAPVYVRRPARPPGVQTGGAPDSEHVMFGWGGRIRTSVWRNQNPLPYHLATPQPAPE